MMMSVEKSVEWLAGETDVFEETLPQCRFIHHKSHMTDLGRRGGQPATNSRATVRLIVQPAPRVLRTYVRNSI
jgi:hypothetical protein